jgi:hypothetical protein
VDSRGPEGIIDKSCRTVRKRRAAEGRARLQKEGCRKNDAKRGQKRSAAIKERQGRF